MELKFRTLNANEIEARVGQATEKGVSLLLYKDARVDMTLLDETVGPMNWQRYHSRDNANCTVAIFDESKGIWVTKEDTGTESNTEAEKGLASDSFKRACVNWGIGRELYTAPFIWISAGEGCEVKPKQNGKGFDCRDKFAVAEIAYNDRREICALSIKNAKTGKVVYTMGKAAQPKKKEAPAETRDTPKCGKCGKEVKSYVSVKTGMEVTAEQHAAITFARYKLVMCRECAVEHEKKLKTVEDYGKKLSEGAQ